MVASRSVINLSRESSERFAIETLAVRMEHGQSG